MNILKNFGIMCLLLGVSGLALATESGLLSVPPDAGTTMEGNGSGSWDYNEEPEITFYDPTGQQTFTYAGTWSTTTNGRVLRFTSALTGKMYETRFLDCSRCHPGISDMWYRYEIIPGPPITYKKVGNGTY